MTITKCQQKQTNRALTVVSFLLALVYRPKQKQYVNGSSSRIVQSTTRCRCEEKSPWSTSQDPFCVNVRTLQKERSVSRLDVQCALLAIFAFSTNLQRLCVSRATRLRCFGTLLLCSTSSLTGGNPVEIKTRITLLCKCAQDRGHTSAQFSAFLLSTFGALESVMIVVEAHCFLRHEPSTTRIAFLFCFFPASLSSALVF